MALISVIIPCYNTDRFIDRCLQSVTRQDIGMDSLEIICVDDASTDSTWERLRDWERRFPDQIALIHLEENGRQGRARNIGLSYAGGELVAFLDSDDWIEPDYLSRMYEAFCRYACDLVVCRMGRDSSEGISCFEDRSTGKESLLLLIDSDEKRNHFLIFNSMENSACARLIRKSLLTDHNIVFPEYLAYEDTFWGSLLHLYASRVYLLEEKLYHYYVNPASTVLAANLDYHVDLLTVQGYLWQEWEGRGFLDCYREALEYDYLHSCYFAFLKVLAFRYDRPPYSLFCLLRKLLTDKLTHLPNNRFLREAAFPELYRILTESLHLPVNRDSYHQMIELIRRIGI